MKKNIYKKSLELHKKLKGKIELLSKVPVTTRDELSLAYTPGVAAVSQAIAEKKERVWELTSRGSWVAIVTDGTAVLGLGDIGPEAALPVMEGKAVLFKEFGGVNAFPICLATKDPDEIVAAVKMIEPSFAGINLEDISAPRCFEIEARLKKELSIPVFHDDQHGTAIVVTAGLLNAAKVVGKSMHELNVVVHGAGAAGIAVTKMLVGHGVSDIILIDRKGIISRGRGGLTDIKKEISKITNKKNISGGLADAVKGADVFIGVSAPDVLSAKMVRTMAHDPIIFALANPVPEIMPEEALKAGAAVVATGRSDYPNQVNNVLAFPGVFRGVLRCRAASITEEMKRAAAHALANALPNPTRDRILPDPLDRTIPEIIAVAVEKAYKIKKR